MKFKFTLALFTLNIFFCKANDTLTVAQVYNFSVGDTFDYYWYDPVAIGYQRIIIQNIYYSGNNDTLFLAEQTIYPSPVQNNTLALTNLNDYEIYTDTVCDSASYLMPHSDSYLYSINTGSSYNGKTVNGVMGYCGYDNYDNLFAEGLGNVYSYSQLNNSDGDPPLYYSINLIYYSKVDERWGTPYTIAGINNIQQQIFISVYPTVNSGDFQVVTEDDADKMQLTVYDVYGRGVKVEDIYGGKNQIHMPGIASGVYLWNVTNPSGLIRSGKIIIE